MILSFKLLRDYPQGVDDAGEPEEDAEDDIEKECSAYAAFEEDSHERKENRQDD